MLKRAGVPDDAVKDAMYSAGLPVQREALRLAPVRSGKLASTIKVNRSKSNLTFTAGNNTTVKYAYTFHAQALGKSKGGFTFRVPFHDRQGARVRSYSRQARIPNRPFLLQAWERNRQKVLEAYVTAVASLLRGA